MIELLWASLVVIVMGGRVERAQAVEDLRMILLRRVAWWAIKRLPRRHNHDALVEELTVYVESDLLEKRRQFARKHPGEMVP